MSTSIPRSFSASQIELRATISVGDAFRDERCAINDQRAAHALWRAIIAAMATATKWRSETCREKSASHEKEMITIGCAARAVPGTRYGQRAMVRTACVARCPQRGPDTSMLKPFSF
jgi:hypothetical protein